MRLVLICGLLQAVLYCFDYAMIHSFVYDGCLPQKTAEFELEEMYDEYK